MFRWEAFCLDYSRSIRSLMQVCRYVWHVAGTSPFKVRTNVCLTQEVVVWEHRESVSPGVVVLYYHGIRRSIVSIVTLVMIMCQESSIFHKSHISYIPLKNANVHDADVITTPRLHNFMLYIYIYIYILKATIQREQGYFPLITNEMS